MPNHCDDSMPRTCAEKFERIGRSLALVDRIAEDVAALRRAVVGNGRAEQSLSFRVGQLERGRRGLRRARARWAERLWKLLVATGLVVLGWWLGSS